MTNDTYKQVMTGVQEAMSGRNVPTVAVHGHDVRVIEYKGERVVTFGQIDEVHERVEGTAKRAFGDNRGRFIEGEDYILATSAQRDEFRTFGIEIPNRGLMLITRRGYLKLVKTLNDDRAWAVFDDMIDCYFATRSMVERAAKKPKVAKSDASAREARLFLKQFISFGKLIGMTGNQLAISASRATKVATGFDPLEAMGAPVLIAPSQEALIIPTEIGNRMGGVSNRAVNELLVVKGYQSRYYDHKNRVYYELTEKGRDAGGVMCDTERRHANGTPVQQIKWPSSIVGRLLAEMH